MSIQEQLRNLRFDADTFEFRKAIIDRLDALEAALREIAATNRMPSCDMARRALMTGESGNAFTE